MMSPEAKPLLAKMRLALQSPPSINDVVAFIGFAYHQSPSNIADAVKRYHHASGFRFRRVSDVSPEHYDGLISALIDVLDPPEVLS